MVYSDLKYPLRIEFNDWYIVSPSITKIVIDIESFEITVKRHNKKKHNVNIKSFELTEDSLPVITDILSSEKFDAYYRLADSQKTDMGYRDGWYTKYKIVWSNKVETGTLSDIYKENPLEQLLTYLRKKYAYIEALKSV